MTDRPDGRVAIPVTLNGSREMFLVDTGGVVTQIGEATARTLGLHALAFDPNIEIYGMDGSRARTYATVETLGIGPGQLQRVPMTLSRLDEDGGPDALQGVLAPGILRNFDLDFDFAGRKLNLILQDHCPGHVVYWAAQYGTVPFSLNVDDGHIEITVSLDGEDVRAIIDTGSNASFIDGRAARDLFGLEAGKPGLDPVQGADADALAHFSRRFSSLSFGDVTVNRPRLYILENKAEEAFLHTHRGDKAMFDPVNAPKLNMAPLTIGMDILSRLHLYIAYGEKTLYVTAAGAGRAAPAQPAAAPAGAARSR